MKPEADWGPEEVSILQLARAFVSIVRESVVKSARTVVKSMFGKKMKYGKYTITTIVGPRELRGYFFNYRGIHLAVSHFIEGSERFWRVSELTTGRAFGGDKKTRSEAIEGAKKLIRAHGVKLVKAICKRYEVKK